MSDFFDDYYSSAHKRPGFIAAELKLDIAKNIEQLLKDHNLSNTEFAEKLGCSKANVTKILSGDANLTIKSIAQIAVALDSEVKIGFFNKTRFKQIQQEIAEFYEEFLKEKRNKEIHKNWFARVKSSNEDSYAMPKILNRGCEDDRFRVA